MASLSFLFRTFPTMYTFKDHQKNNLRHSIDKIDGTFRFPSTTNVNKLNITQNGDVKYGVSQRAQSGDLIEMELNQGSIFDRVKYRQTYVIRSTEVGPNKTATFESLLNLVQETGLNHFAMMGINGDEYGATNEMMRSNLIWVVSRMQVEVGDYPKWGEKIVVECWYASSTKHSIQRESLIRSSATGLILAQAASTWVLMSRTTRRLSKMSETLRTEFSPWMIDKPTIALVNKKIGKLDIDAAKYLISNLKAIPDRILQTHRLSNMVLEYRKECGVSDVVESLCESCDDGVRINEFDEGQLRYTHLLQIKREGRNEEIVRGRTTWRKKEQHLLPIL